MSDALRTLQAIVAAAKSESLADQGGCAYVHEEVTSDGHGGTHTIVRHCIAGQVLSDAGLSDKILETDNEANLLYRDDFDKIREMVPDWLELGYLSQAQREFDKNEFRLSAWEARLAALAEGGDIT